MTTDTTERFPVDWEAWRDLWRDWCTANREHLKPGHYPWPPANLMADEVLGRWTIGARQVELSAVTFRIGETSRYVGISYGTDERAPYPDGRGHYGVTVVPEPTGIAASFDELEAILARDCGVTFR